MMQTETTWRTTYAAKRSGTRRNATTPKATLLQRRARFRILRPLQRTQQEQSALAVALVSRKVDYVTDDLLVRRGSERDSQAVFRVRPSWLASIEGR